MDNRESLWTSVGHGLELTVSPECPTRKEREKGGFLSSHVVPPGNLVKIEQESGSQGEE